MRHRYDDTDVKDLRAHANMRRTDERRRKMLIASYAPSSKMTVSGSSRCYNVRNRSSRALALTFPAWCGSLQSLPRLEPKSVRNSWIRKRLIAPVHQTTKPTTRKTEEL